MKLHFVSKLAAGLLVCAAALPGQAALIAGSDPYLLDLSGTASDPSGPAAVQSFTAPSGATLDRIVWWGYRFSIDPLGPTDDDFTVLLGGALQNGTLTTSSVGPSNLNAQLVRYELDVADSLLTASTLSIQSQSDGFAWAWQGTSALNAPGYTFAFNLLGELPDGTVPEPGSLALLAMAGLALVATRRTR